MDTYTTLRHFADSWGLLALSLVLAGVWVFAFRPGAGAVHADASAVPFRHDAAPEGAASAPASCAGCSTCTCGGEA